MTDFTAQFCTSVQGYPFYFVIAAIVGPSAGVGFVLGYEIVLRRWERATSFDNHPLAKFMGGKK